jgi:sugar/nucleoside kinase (ribokinase family)
VAFDSIKTPFGEALGVVGGAATYFSVAASFFTDVRVVAVVGDDFAGDHLALFRGRRIDLAGLQRVSGRTFRWRGEYSFDLNNRETVYTHLNVFAEFRPTIPDGYKDSPFVFLGNIQPALQLDVLDHVPSPRFVAADTMNYWIDRTPDELKTVLRRVDALIINDAEARQLSGEPNLLRAARAVQAMGPRLLVIKRGEHGVLLVHEQGLFAAPAMPLDEVFDPTGAGDTFAGGFVGYLAARGDLGFESLARATVYGSALASFAVQDFGLNRLLTLTLADVEGRFAEFKRLTHFELV